MVRGRLFEIWPLDRDREFGGIEPSAPEHRIPPQGTCNVPGYVARMIAALHGEIEPWWGTEYESYGVFPADFVRASPGGHAVSDRLREVFEENAVAGVRFHPVLVNGMVPMHLMIVTGRVAVNPKAFELQLLDGAEVGFHKGISMYVAPRVVDLVRRAKIPLYYRCLVDDQRRTAPFCRRRSPR